MWLYVLDGPFTNSESSPFAKAQNALYYQLPWVMCFWHGQGVRSCVSKWVQELRFTLSIFTTYRKTYRVTQRSVTTSWHSWPRWLSQGQKIQASLLLLHTHANAHKHIIAIVAKCSSPVITQNTLWADWQVVAHSVLNVSHVLPHV